MTYTPQSDVYLCKTCPLDNRYEHTIKFISRAYQNSYFQTLVSDNISNYKYIKNQNTIDLPLNYEVVRSVNYLYYINDSKRVYCFVIDKQYLNENTTRFFIETDVMQTHQFDYTLRECFVEREHRDRWKREGYYKPIKNTTNESVYYGNEYQIESRKEIIQPTHKVRWLAVFASDALVDSSSETKPFINNHYHPFYTYLIPFRDDGLPLYFRESSSAEPSTNSVEGITHFPAALTSKIVGICLLGDYTGNYTVADIGGKITITASSLEIIKFNTYDLLKVKNGHNISATKTYPLHLYSDFSIQLPAGFTKTQLYNTNLESRLLYYPYTHMMLSDNVSTPFTFVFDGISNESVNIALKQSYSYPTQKHLSIPGYRGDTYGDIYRLSNNQAQEMVLLNDAYVDYLRNNKNSIATGLTIGAIGGVVTSLATGNIAGLAMAGLSTFSQIAMETAKGADLEQIPTSYRNLGSDLYLTLASNKYSPVLLKWGLMDEYKKSVAKHFFNYGYRVNIHKKPNLDNRWRFNYVKTIGCMIQASFDMDDITKICSIYDNGVTLWHYRDSTFDMFNYNYDNPEMSLL